MKKISKRAKVSLWVVVAVVVLLLAAFITVFMVFQSRTVPGARVGELSVGNLNRQELQEKLDKAFDDQTVTYKIDGETTQASLKDAGFSLDTDATVEKLLADNSSPFALAAHLFTGVDVTPVFTVDKAQVEKFGQTLPLSEDNQVKEPTAVFNSEDQIFHLVDGKAGQGIDIKALEQDTEAAVTKEAGTSRVPVVNVKTVEEQPAVSEANAQAALEKANQWLTLDLSVRDNASLQEFPSRDIRATWLTFTPEGDQIVISANKENIGNWVEEFAKETGRDPEPGLRNMNPDGTVAAVARPAVSGLVASNTKEVSEALASSVESMQNQDLSFKYDEKDGGWTDRPVAAGAENLVYKPAEGEKWIDLNLEEASVTLYEGTKVVAGPFPMVPGAPETPTVKGDYNVYLKYDTQTMRGENSDGSKYETPGVPWVTYFTGSYAFHGAYWRDSFGWNGPGGSHGCINMRIPDAKTLYDWADMGTKVVSH